MKSGKTHAWPNLGRFIGFYPCLQSNAAGRAWPPALFALEHLARLANASAPGKARAAARVNSLEHPARLRGSLACALSTVGEYIGLGRF